MKRVLLLSITFITVTAALISCKSRDSLIIGKWHYDKKLNKNAVPEFGVDKVMVTFNKDGTCASSKGLGNDIKGTYKLINNENSLITQMDKVGRSDTVRILGLTSGILQIETPAKDTIQFKKVR